MNSYYIFSCDNEWYCGYVNSSDFLDIYTQLLMNKCPGSSLKLSNGGMGSGQGFYEMGVAIVSC